MIFLLSYIWGIIPDPKSLKGKYSYEFLYISKGAIPLWITQLLFGTGISLFLTSIGVILGHLVSPVHHYKPRVTFLVTMGALLAFNYIAFIHTTLILVIIYIITSKIGLTALLISLFLPVILWLSTRLDIYAIFGAIHGLLGVYQLIPYLHTGDKRVLRGIIKPERNSAKILIKRIVAAFIIITYVTLMFFNRYVYRGFGMQVDIIRKGTPEFPIIALTFDDGPDPRYTPYILDILKEKNVPAAFFVCGIHVNKYPHIARRIVDEGHEIGNHTYTHRSLIPLSHSRTVWEIDRTHEIIEEVTGVKPVLFRPPRGVYSDFAREYLKEKGYTIVLWDVTSRDWSEISAREITNNILNNTVNGSILLFHDSGNIVTPKGGYRMNTVRALPHIIDELQNRRFKFVSLQEMIFITGLTTLEEIEEDEAYIDYY